MKSELWIKAQENQQSFIGPTVLLPSCREEARALSGDRILQVLATPTRCPVAVAHAEFLAALAKQPPRPIPVDADSTDLQGRAEHLGALFGGLAAYLAVVLDDTAQNVPGGLDLRDAEAILADLAADLTGAIQHAADEAADEMVGRVE